MKKIRGKYFSYLHMDFVRAFASPEFFISIAGVLLTLFFGCYGDGFRDTSIIRLIWYSTFGIQFLFVMIFGAIPYAGVVCEDLEYGYVNQVLIRGNLKSYCTCKTITVLASSVVSFAAGMLLFVGLLRLKIPWVDVKDSVYMSAIRSGSFRTLLQNQHYYLYVILFSVQTGLLIGLLSLVSVCISLFVSNKLLVFSIPVMAYYFITQYAAEIFPENNFFNLNFIYGGTRNICDNDILSFLYAVFFTFAICCLLWAIMYRKLKRRIGGE